MNSYHPKSASDQSGSGVGLRQVTRRLELLYPGRYEWEQGLRDSGKIFLSSLTIQTMILNCVLVDDEPLALALLKSYVEKTDCLRLAGAYASAVETMYGLSQHGEVHLG